MLLKHKLWTKLIFLKEIHSNDIFNFGWDIFLAISTTELVKPPLLTYPLLCSTCVTYGTPCHARGQRHFPPNPVIVSATNLRERFLLSGVIYLALLPAVFKASLGASSSTSKLAGLHANLQNIAPTPLLAWITAIHKSFTLVGSI